MSDATHPSMRVFLSYSGVDRSIAPSVVAMLKSLGVSIDKIAARGQDLAGWRELVVFQLDQANRVVVCLGAGAFDALRDNESVQHALQQWLRNAERALPQLTIVFPDPTVICRDVSLFLFLLENWHGTPLSTSYKTDKNMNSTLPKKNTNRNNFNYCAQEGCNSNVGDFISSIIADQIIDDAFGTSLNPQQADTINNEDAHAVVAKYADFFTHNSVVEPIYKLSTAFASGKAEPKNSAPLFSKVRRALANKYGDEIYAAWFGMLEFEGIDADIIRVSAPTKFIVKWITEHYRDVLLECCRAGFPSVARVDITLRQPNNAGPIAAANSSAAAPATLGISRRIAALTARHRQLLRTCALGFEGVPMDPRYTFDTFVVGNSNCMAHAAAAQIVDAIDTRAPWSSMLYIHGGDGLGKTLSFDCYLSWTI